MDHWSKASRVRVSSERSRWTSFVAGAIATFLVIAVLKPWPAAPSNGVGPTTPGPQSTTHGSAPTSAEPSGQPAVSDPNAMTCLGGDENQLVALERWPGREVRSWVAAPDVPGAGPLDRRLTPILLVSTHLVGIGVCGSKVSVGPPVAGPGSRRVDGSPARFIDVRSIVNDGGLDVTADLGAGPPITVASDEPNAAVLYGPPARPQASSVPSAAPTGRPGTGGETSQPSQGVAAGPVLPAWVPAEYAIGFRFDRDDPTAIRWVRIRIVPPADGQ